jgi:hypothetical protein
MLREQLRYNGATGGERHGRWAGVTTWEECLTDERSGKLPRYNGATGASDMAGKAARVEVEPSGSERDTITTDLRRAVAHEQESDVRGRRSIDCMASQIRDWEQGADLKT